MLIEQRYPKNTAYISPRHTIQLDIMLYVVAKGL